MFFSLGFSLSDKHFFVFETYFGSGKSVPPDKQVANQHRSAVVVEEVVPLEKLERQNLLLRPLWKLRAGIYPSRRNMEAEAMVPRDGGQQDENGCENRPPGLPRGVRRPCLN